MSIRRAARNGETASSGKRGGVKTVLRPRRLFVLALLVVAAVVAVVVGWSSVTAQARAVIVLSSVLETPVLTPAIEVLTPEPAIEDTVFAG